MTKKILVKPPLETEMFTAFASSVDKKTCDEIDKESVEIEYKGIKFSLLNFTSVFDDSKKIIFAFKIKDRTAVFYKAENLSSDAEANLKRFFEYITPLSDIMGFRWQDMRETLESIYLETTYGALKKSKENKNESGG
jgi:hypothetical protein